MIFCTLFDSYYLDKGIVLYNSLARVSDNLKLHIYAFDEKTFDVLTSMNLQYAYILKKDDLKAAYPILERLEKERSTAEFSWTCTPVSIECILDHFNEPNCTYIDADLCFFKDPQRLEEEIDDCDANTVITPHRFLTAEMVYIFLIEVASTAWSLTTLITQKMQERRFPGGKKSALSGATIFMSPIGWETRNIL